MDDLLNGRPAEPWKDDPIGYGRKCELERDLRQLKGLLAVFPREEPPVPRPVTDLAVLR